MHKESETAPARQAAEWGLAALLLSTIVLILFPLMAVLILGSLIAAWESRGVESRHIDFGVVGMYVVVYGLLALGIFALGCGGFGIITAARRGQPFGLAVAGTLAAVVAVGAAAVLSQIGNYSAEDVRKLQRQRFRTESGRWSPWTRGFQATAGTGCGPTAASGRAGWRSVEPPV